MGEAERTFYTDMWPIEKKEKVNEEDLFIFFAFSIVYVNYYLDAWYVLKEKLWWINKQLWKSSIGCFTLQGILSLAFDTISAAGKDFQSSERWSIAWCSKTPCRARQTKKSLWTCRIKSHLPVSATPAWAGKLCPHFFRPHHDKQMEPRASLFFTAMQLKFFLKM